MEHERKDISYQIQQGYKPISLIHLVNKETLKEQHRKQAKSKASGVDKVTKEKYEEHLEENLEDLIIRMKKFSYKPKPVRRTYIPKANGKLRPLGVPTYEDKLIQGVMAGILNEIYEPKFYNFSYGFRPKKSCHQAIRYINQTIMTKKVNYILDCDIKGFFDNVNHEILMQFLRNDIGDKNFLRYVNRFLISGYIEDFQYHNTTKGTPQGGLISPILANVYLHYVLDWWFQEVVKPKLKGEAYIVRYADDFLIMFQYENEAKEVYERLVKRLAKFGLEIEQNKTRILPFGRYKGTEESFDFLGFTFYNGSTSTKKYRIKIKTSKKKLKQKKEQAKKWLRENITTSIFIMLEKIKLVIIGHYNYYGVNDNYLDLLKYYKYIKYEYYRVLKRRSQTHPIPYSKYMYYWNLCEIPKPHICVNIW